MLLDFSTNPWGRLGTGETWPYCRASRQQPKDRARQAVAGTSFSEIELMQ
jgi:hypothetical protein